MNILGSIIAYEIKIRDLKEYYYGLGSVTCFVTENNKLDKQLNIFYNGNLVKPFIMSKRLEKIIFYYKML